jgi:hypothetical protein
MLAAPQHGVNSESSDPAQANAEDIEAIKGENTIEGDRENDPGTSHGIIPKLKGRVYGPRSAFWFSSCLRTCMAGSSSSALPTEPGSIC